MADKPVGALTVAAVTFANGGDNIGVYVPVFIAVGTGALVAYFGSCDASVGALRV
nr:hypothetical protein [uncultured Nocardioides sp.]